MGWANIDLMPPWAARYSTWLLIKLTPKGVVFCCSSHSERVFSTSCRTRDDDQPALQFTDSELTEVFDSFCLYSKRQSADMQMLKSCIGDMTESHPGLVLHMLDVLDDNSKHAHKQSTEYVAQAQARYLGSSFIPRLQDLRSFLR